MEKTADNVDEQVDAVVQNLPTKPVLQVSSTGLTDTTAEATVAT